MRGMRYACGVGIQTCWVWDMIRWPSPNLLRAGRSLGPSIRRRGFGRMAHVGIAVRSALVVSRRVDCLQKLKKFRVSVSVIKILRSVHPTKHLLL